MLQIDRNAPLPIFEQVLQQLRYQIATGKYPVSESLPSTRNMAERLGISFHTVRKAYQQLEQEGLLTSRVGCGYTVIDRKPLGKSERMERGAALIQDALHRLIGLGMQEAEIEYLLEEQMTFLERPAIEQKIIFVAPFREMAELCADQVAASVQVPVQPVTYRQLSTLQHADYAVTTIQHAREAMEALPHTDVIGVFAYPTPSTLEQIARLLPGETLGVVTRNQDAIAPLSEDLRRLTGFPGQIAAATVDAPIPHLKQMLRQVNLVVFTPQSRRKLIPHLSEVRHAGLTYVVSKESLQKVGDAIPT